MVAHFEGALDDGHGEEVIQQVAPRYSQEQWAEASSNVGKGIMKDAQYDDVDTAAASFNEVMTMLWKMEEAMPKHNR